MEVRSGCREHLPESSGEWEIKSIAQIAPLQRGFDLPTHQLSEGPYPVVYSNGIMAFHDSAMARGPGVVTGRSGTLGKVHYVEADYWPHNTSLWVTTFNGNDPRFIFHLYNAIGFGRFASGSGVPTLNRNDAHSFSISIPPTLAEQEAIAEALSDADALIESLEQLIAKKRQIKQGAMQELLTGKRRLPGFSGGWDTVLLDSIATVTSGKRLPLGQSLSNTETPHPYLRVVDMRMGGVSLADIKFVPIDVFPAISRYRIFVRDLFISVAGTLGTVGKIPPELDGANLTENANRITDISCSQEYLLHFLMSPIIQKVIDSIQTIGAQPKLALTRIRKFNISLPPTLREQEAIAEVLSDIETLIESLERRLAQARQVKQGMMQELLTGRIRLV